MFSTLIFEGLDLRFGSVLGKRFEAKMRIDSETRKRVQQANKYRKNQHEIDASARATKHFSNKNYCWV